MWHAHRVPAYATKSNTIVSERFSEDNQKRMKTVPVVWKRIDQSVLGDNENAYL